MNRASITEKVWTFRGYPCRVIFQPIGFRCGYVGLPSTSPYYGRSWDKIDLNVHGGLTYAKNELVNESATNLWWIGFDCGHCDDLNDYGSLRKYYHDNAEVLACADFHEKLDSQYPIPNAKVRDLDYVVKECESLVDQLYVQEEEDEDREPPMIFGNILIPLEDWRVAKEALCDECMLEESEAYRIMNLVFDIALCNAEEDKS